ncbi:hypothetical protein Tco_0374575 [Tanacetum coccineum]
MTAKRNQERVKSILLLAIPEAYLLKFHNVPDAKSLWAAIKSRFGGNDESKKMQRNVLKHQFENFTTAPNKSLDKAYDRFQKLISQLEVHVAPVSKEDINQKFLRSFLPSWSQITLIMRNKPDINQTDIDDLYNNLRVYEDEMKRSSSSISNSQNLAFLSSENTSSTNETTSPLLDNEDLQQIDQDDLEELDIRQQVAMLTIKMQRFVKKTRRNLDFKEKQLVTFDKSKTTPANDRFSKADRYHVVPPPITGNFLTPRADISFAGKTNEGDNMDKVIIEDWNSYDEDDVSNVNTVSPVKTNETRTVKTQADKISQTSQKVGIGYKKIKACFVCKSTDHLIKDCNFHAKKSPEPKLKIVVNTGQRVVKPVWDNAKRGNPEILLQDHAVVDSGCSSHMTGNKAYLSDYEDYNGGFVAFGSDPKGGKITGKGKIRTANLDFDNVYFVDELKFNLFSVSQMCDKKNINKLVKGHLVRGLPSKVFVNV